MMLTLKMWKIVTGLKLETVLRKWLVIKSSKREDAEKIEVVEFGVDGLKKFNFD